MPNLFLYTGYIELRSGHHHNGYIRLTLTNRDLIAHKPISYSFVEILCSCLFPYLESTFATSFTVTIDKVRGSNGPLITTITDDQPVHRSIYRVGCRVTRFNCPLTETPTGQVCDAKGHQDASVIPSYKWLINHTIPAPNAICPA